MKSKKPPRAKRAAVTKRAAAAASLQDQGALLLKLVSVFKIDGAQTAGRAPAPSRRPATSTIAAKKASSPPKVAPKRVGTSVAAPKPVGVSRESADEWEEF